MKATLTGALGGLLFGFDTVVIAGAIDCAGASLRPEPAEQGPHRGHRPGRHGDRRAGRRTGGPEARQPRDPAHHRDALCRLGRSDAALAWNWSSFMVFRFIGGLGIGASSVLGPVYIAELAPAKWRGRLVAAFQFNVVFGIMVAYTSNYVIRTMHLGATEWRWQVGIAAVPAVAFLVLLFGIPRSPRWSASKNRIDEALAVLKMMGEPNPQAELDDIRAALAQEHASAHEPVFQLEVPLSAVSRHLHRRVQPARRHQRHSLLPQQHLRRRRLQPDLERPAGHRHRRNQLSVHHRGHVADRQSWAARRCC